MGYKILKHNIMYHTKMGEPILPVCIAFSREPYFFERLDPEKPLPPPTTDS
jgi:predicted GNAT family acetyltransferase